MLANLPRPILWGLRGLVGLGVVVFAVVLTFAALYVLALLIAIEVVASMSYGGR